MCITVIVIMNINSKSKFLDSLYIVSCYPKRKLDKILDA